MPLPCRRQRLLSDWLRLPVFFVVYLNERRTSNSDVSCCYPLLPADVRLTAPCLLLPLLLLLRLVLLLECTVGCGFLVTLRLFFLLLLLRCWARPLLLLLPPPLLLLGPAGPSAAKCQLGRQRCFQEA